MVRTGYNECMNKPLKLIPIGNSIGVVIPKDLLRDLGAVKGDLLIAIRTPNGVELRIGDPEFESDMKLARDIMREDRVILRELAK